jgi:fido (protein-threonine AMPylation protein)
MTAAARSTFPSTGGAARPRHAGRVSARFEYIEAVGRPTQIENGSVAIAKTNDGDHLRAIHGQLLQDVYERAAGRRRATVVWCRRCAPTSAIAASGPVMSRTLATLTDGGTPPPAGLL